MSLRTTKAWCYGKPSLLLGKYFFFHWPGNTIAEFSFFGQDTGTMLDVHILDSVSLKENGLDDLLR